MGSSHEAGADKLVGEEYPSFLPHQRGSTDAYGKMLKAMLGQKVGGVYAEARYVDEAELMTFFQDPSKVAAWRVKERMKTVGVALVLCLNIGVDPPDVLKIPPFAKLQCWIDPTEQTPAKSLENIGRNLQAQYEVWQSKARFKQCLDPTVEDVKKLCTAMRKTSKDERILFHYNGHGVPKPTSNGEIWVFNKQYTQYIPLSLYELQSWMGNPAMYVFDCSAGGVIVQSYLHFADQRDRENERRASSGSGYSSSAEAPVNARDAIILVACGANETLPLNADLPADLFTSCLTTPIQVAIKWFARRSQLIRIPSELADIIPGRLIDRRTPLGELNWIFTAVTDTIAWNMMPPDLFQKLFRQDMLVASLLRNFLLAERVMRTFNCSPMCYPKIPSTYNHHLWESWDLAVESYLVQMPQYEKDPNYVFQPSSFFSEQLTAFEMWLELATDGRGQPEQLPIVLQVLLSQSHRLRALRLLARFLDLGPWAVNMALSVGIFPYVLKLLQSPAAELRETLVFIWAKILSVDQTCQVDLVKENCHQYFVNVLATPNIPQEQRTQAAYVLSLIMYKYPAGQNACLSADILSLCTGLLDDGNFETRLWSCFCIANLWHDNDEVKAIATKEKTPEKILRLLSDTCPEVRAAAIFTLGNYIGKAGAAQEQRSNSEHSIGISLLLATSDLSTLVRKEQIMALSRLIGSYSAAFQESAFVAAVAELRRRAEELSEPLELGPEVDTLVSEYSRQQGSTYAVIWEVITQLAVDPVPIISQLAISVIQHVHSSFTVKLPLEKLYLSISQTRALRKPPPARGSVRASSPPKPVPVTPPVALKRAASSIAFGAQRPLEENPEEKLKRTASFDISSPNDKFESPRLITDYAGDESGLGVQRSNLFEWSCQRFNISIQAREPDPHSYRAYERMWRYSRNQKLNEEIASLRTKSISSKFDKQIAILDNNSELIYAMTFHPYEVQLVVADEKSNISVWDIENGTKLNHFHNMCPSKNRITSFKMYSDADLNLLAASSDDAVVRIWRNYDLSGEQQLVSAWRAFPTLSLKQNGSGLVMDWSTESDVIVTSGDVKSIKLWSVERELSFQEIPTETDASVTCIAASRNTMSVGFSDGMVKLYDIRAPNTSSLVQTFTEHKAWVVNTFIQKHGQQDIISGSVSGDIRFWDVRAGASVKSITAHSSSMVSFTAHDNVPLLASGSKNQHIKIFNTKAETLNILQYHNGFLGQRIGVVSSLAFHPHHLLLAAGSADSIISIYSGVNTQGDR
eukprot:TRINITY_DN3858_c0_g2_i1.p1 TRINITY_DN3858_c0_g2~~TRINITY_DN3858_c0_g2_i1.p1  ORF type:complete len:1260 (+),score=219.57 TRINITY_DN3858_c0_g2_i1:53-3832(+)